MYGWRSTSRSGWLSTEGTSFVNAVHFDPEHVEDRPGGRVARSMFDPSYQGATAPPMADRLMNEDELRAYLEATTDYDAMWTVVSGADLLKLQQGEKLEAGGGFGLPRSLTLQYGDIEDQLSRLPFGEAARPDHPAYVLQVKSRGRARRIRRPSLQRVNSRPRDVQGIIEANPTIIRAEIDFPTDNDDPYDLQVATAYGFRPARMKILPNVEPIDQVATPAPMATVRAA